MSDITVEIGNVLKYEQPTKYIVESTNYVDNGIPVLTPGQTFILGFTKEEHGIYKYPLPVIIFDDFTTAFKYVDFPFKVKSSAMKILKADSNIADIRFLYYKMQTVKIISKQHKRYWISKYSKIKIPLPPLSTQKEIAEILDLADNFRQKTKALLEKYDQLAQSLFLDMFGDPVTNPKGWEVKKLGEITSKIGSGATPTGGKDSYKREGISLIRSLNVHDNKFLYKDLALIDNTQAKKLDNVIVENGDVLFNITGASVCRCAIVPEKVLPARVNQHVAILRPVKDILNNHFLMSLLISANFKQKLQALSISAGATREAITKEQLIKLEIPVSPIHLQNQFAERIQEIEKQKAAAKKSLGKAEDLFNSLLQKAFKGELVAEEKL